MSAFFLFKSRAHQSLRSPSMLWTMLYGECGNWFCKFHVGMLIVFLDLVLVSRLHMPSARLQDSWRCGASCFILRQINNWNRLLITMPIIMNSTSCKNAFIAKSRWVKLLGSKVCRGDLASKPFPSHWQLPDNLSSYWHDRAHVCNSLHTPFSPGLSNP